MTDKNHKLQNQRAFEILKSGHTLWHSIVRTARLGHIGTLLQLLYRMKNLIEMAIATLEPSSAKPTSFDAVIENNKGSL